MELTDQIIIDKINNYPWTPWAVTKERIIEAIEIIQEVWKAAATILQRKMALWFQNSAYIIDIIEIMWLIWPQSWAKPRDIYLDKINDFLISIQ